MQGNPPSRFRLRSGSPHFPGSTSTNGLPQGKQLRWMKFLWSHSTFFWNSPALLAAGPEVMAKGLEHLGKKRCGSVQLYQRPEVGDTFQTFHELIYLISSIKYRGLKQQSCRLFDDHVRGLWPLNGTENRWPARAPREMPIEMNDRLKRPAKWKPV